MVQNCVYARLVITALDGASLHRAQGFVGPDATFTATIQPPLTSLVLDVGMQGRRHMSRLPLNDIRNFGDRFLDMQFVDGNGKTFSGPDLEAVFGPCPARTDPMAAFNARSVCFNFSGEAFTKPYSQKQQQQGPVVGDAVAQQDQGKVGQAQQDNRAAETSTAVAALFNEAKLALQSLEALAFPTPTPAESGEGPGPIPIPGSGPALQLMRCLNSLEGLFVVRSGTETRTRVNEASGAEERIGGYSYQPKFLLDAVLMSDNLREPSLLKPAISKAVQLITQPQTSDHFQREIEQARLPRAPCLYDARITFDMCTMLWSREHLLSSKAERARPWVLHLRCDSSPQFGRDFLVIQADYVQYGTDSGATTITKRLLPIQCVGSRAGSEGHKLDKILFSLTLESEQALWAERILFCCSRVKCTL